MEPIIHYPNETIRAISEFLFIETARDKLGTCDLTLVLGNDFIVGTVQEIKALIDSEVISPNSKIVLSGATGSLNAGKEKECVRMYQAAVDLFNIDPKQLVLEDQATNAYQNLQYIKQLIENDRHNFPTNTTLDSFNRILIIGKSFMLRRTEMCARALGYPMEKLVYFGTVDREGRNIGKDSWWLSDAATMRIYGEIERIGKYAAAGDLSVF